MKIERPGSAVPVQTRRFKAIRRKGPEGTWVTRYEFPDRPRDVTADGTPVGFTADVALLEFDDGRQDMRATTRDGRVLIRPARPATDVINSAGFAQLAPDQRALALRTAQRASMPSGKGLARGRGRSWLDALLVPPGLRTQAIHGLAKTGAKQQRDPKGRTQFVTEKGAYKTVVALDDLTGDLSEATISHGDTLLTRVSIEYRRLPKVGYVRSVLRTERPQHMGGSPVILTMSLSNHRFDFGGTD